MKNSKNKKTHTYFSYLHRRLAVVSLWYCALAASFLVLLLLTALYQPKVVSYLLFGAPALSWLSASEASHMSDVQVIVRDALLIGISAAIVLGSYWYKRGLDRGMARSALAMQAVLLILLIPFNWTFRRFHEIFFPQGNWQFSADSWLIQTFPISFFALFASLWFLLSLLALYLLHRSRDSKSLD